MCEPARRRAWLYANPGGVRPWLAGGTLCYRKTSWRRFPFPHLVQGEDSVFVSSAAHRAVCDIDDVTFYIAMVHGHNTSLRPDDGGLYRPHPFEEVVRLTGGSF